MPLVVKNILSRSRLLLLQLSSKQRDESNRFGSPDLPCRGVVDVPEDDAARVVNGLSYDQGERRIFASRRHQGNTFKLQRQSGGKATVLILGMQLSADADLVEHAADRFRNNVPVLCC